jgi:hypothetical protein
LIKEHILQTIRLAHYYNSAFDRDQLYKYLRIKINRTAFESILDQLIDQHVISEDKGFIFNGDLQTQHEQRQQWSRELLQKYKIYIKILSIIPWIKFIGLTGSNAFESCDNDDDLDIFIICKQDRLWICYFSIVLISKLFKKRKVLCVNYLVDEKNLLFGKKTYYTAVQLVQMLPVYNKPSKQILIQANPWLATCLPNLNNEVNPEIADQKKENKGSGFQFFSGLMQKMNKLIFERYYLRIAKKFPDYIGTSMTLKEGVAKLHHIDNHDIYDSLNSAKIQSIQNIKAV